MEIFVCVVDTGNFSAVAQERGMGQTTVNKQVFVVETELGCCTAARRLGRADHSLRQKG